MARIENEIRPKIKYNTKSLVASLFVMVAGETALNFVTKKKTVSIYLYVNCEPIAWTFKFALNRREGVHFNL